LILPEIGKTKVVAYLIPLLYAERNIGVRMRRIIHIDMDAFFASVEQVKNPDLKGKPVIVGGKNGDRRGVVSTCSYEAREFGVHSAMPMVQAQKLCPQGIFISGSLSDYASISKNIRSILFEVSPLVEMASIDEGYIDISGSIRLFSSEEHIAKHLKNRIAEETGLTCTIGVASNRLVAKIASDADKPDGFLPVASGEEADFIAPMKVNKIPGLGSKMCESLNRMGIYTVNDLQGLTEKALMQRFGNWGITLYRKARGIGCDSLQMSHVPKSMSRETTFGEDSSDWPYVESVLSYLMERTLYGLREKGMEGRRVTLKVRNSQFKTHTYSLTLPEPTNLDAVVWEHIKPLIESAYKEIKLVRLIGFNIGELTSGHHQMMLENIGNTEQWEKAMEGVDSLRERFGFQSLHTGKSLASGKSNKSSNPPSTK